jgi:hypothetical protein
MLGAATSLIPSQLAVKIRAEQALNCPAFSTHETLPVLLDLAAILATNGRAGT